MPIILKGSFRCSRVGAEGFPTNIFWAREKGMKFLRENALLKGKITCPKCSSNMDLWKSGSVIDKYHWWHRKEKTGKWCNPTQSLTHSSQVIKSKLIVLEIMLMTWHRAKSAIIHNAKSIAGRSTHHMWLVWVLQASHTGLCSEHTRNDRRRG
jgi:hypothetical protein